MTVPGTRKLFGVLQQVVLAKRKHLETLPFGMNPEKLGDYPFEVV